MGETYARHRGGRQSVSKAIQEMREDVERADFSSRKYKTRGDLAKGADKAAAAGKGVKEFKAQGRIDCHGT